jgi:hypothetical protein
MPVAETHVEGNTLAKKHHLDLLKQRVHTWHQWRQARELAERISMQEALSLP